jgi:hypothetical protein
VVDCYVFGTPPLDFDGAVRRRRHSQPYQRAPSIGTGADCPQAEERAKAADAHRIALVSCDEFLFFVFLAEALKKITVCPVVKKGSAKSRTVGFYSNSHMFKTKSVELTNGYQGILGGV